MIQKIKRHLISLSAAALLLVPAVVPATVAAQDIAGNLCSGTNISLPTDSTGSATANTGCSNSSTTNINTILQWAVNIFSAIVGVIAVVMIIVGGLKYITSGGDSSKVGSAKNTLLYAIIGLVIVALAQVIVHFVIAKSSNAFSSGGL